MNWYEMFDTRAEAEAFALTIEGSRVLFIESDDDEFIEHFPQIANRWEVSWEEE